MRTVDAASPWVTRFAELVPEGGAVLDTRVLRHARGMPVASGIGGGSQ